MKALEKNELPFEKEILTDEQQYNEYVMTSLRTMWGCDLKKIKSWGETFETHFTKQSKIFLKNNTMKQEGDNFILTLKGKLLADNISMELFL